jgi:hypothetical protein
MFFDFIEIGTSDFETEIEKLDKKIGLSIEAVKYYIDKLPNKSGCIKINNGVSNFNGTITINYLTVENIKKYNLPNWVRGCNSVNHCHPTVSRLLLDKGIQIQDVVTNYTVPCKTLIFILNEYNTQGLYLLKVDTEGHDSIILEHFLKNNESNNLLPHKIIFESNVLTTRKDVNNIINISEKLGYELFSRGHDTVLKLNLNKMNKTFIFSSGMVNYYIEDYPEGYDPNNLPHENTLEAAKKYCILYKCSGITYQHNRYEVRSGDYINYENLPKLLSWIVL